MKSILFALCAIVLCACTSSGPKNALDALAKAMESNNSQEFIAGFDMNAYANNEIRHMTRNETMNIINSFGKMLGLGSVDDLIASIVDVKREIESTFTRQIASGELMAQCRVATTPDCPWVPESLRSAQIVEIGQDAAIAKVTTPARLTSWISLRKISGKWLVVGQAVMESEARNLATTPLQTPPARPAPAGSQKNISL